VFDTRPTADDIRPPMDQTAPCKICGGEVTGMDFTWEWWDQHLAWHQWVWDQLNPA
jgi:hypothetical protein